MEGSECGHDSHPLAILEVGGDVRREAERVRVLNGVPRLVQGDPV